jgi:hypothetical protein
MILPGQNGLRPNESAVLADLEYVLKAYPENTMLSKGRAWSSNPKFDGTHIVLTAGDEERA